MLYVKHCSIIDQHRKDNTTLIILVYTSTLEHSITQPDLIHSILTKDNIYIYIYIYIYYILYISEFLTNSDNSDQAYIASMPNMY